ncbi:zinc finger protein 839 [Streptomyces shenzhenensis]|uniref:zinc finger protein 839 n=1 Tax=Streptomyces shenzhenensis TaxID=943815 RepID=UPI00217DB3CF|nr:zinc finger protein 839 [Streptomyces shenzhenensis]
MRHTRPHLGEPPLVAAVGVGVYGVVSPADVFFRLPGPGQPHLYGYGYDAGLGVDGTQHLVRPGRVRLVPPRREVRHRWRGRSEHLCAQLRSPVAGPAHRVPVVQYIGPERPLRRALLGQAVAAVLRASRAAGPRSGPAVAHSRPGVRRRTPRYPPGVERRRRPHRGRGRPDR